MTRKAVVALGLAAGAVAALLLLRSPSSPDFARDVAPILGARCAGCHRPEGGAPFSLMDVDALRGRASQIADVARRRLMPPWPPERGAFAFQGDRSLSDGEIDTLVRWADAGGKVGPARVEPPPGAEFREDLRVELVEPFPLPAEGPDVYRNFVVPLPLDAPKAVVAWRFLPGPTSAVHHAFLLFDKSGEAARQDARDPAPGFGGLHAPRGAEAPAGHFMSWQPGAEPRRSGDFPWSLEPGALVIQAHLRPTGKPELVRPAVAFTFGERVSPIQPVKIPLFNYEIDIPPRAVGHVVRDSFTLPVDVDLLGLLPHAHYRARSFEVKTGATTLLRIPRWSFDWQGDYVFAAPVPLAKGSVITMEVVYDNPSERPLRYGVESSDEMAELTLRALPREPGGAGKIEAANAPRVVASGVTYNRYLLAKDPADGRARAELGKALLLLGRADEAEPQLAEASRLRPDDDEPRYFLGLSMRVRKRPDEALLHFREAIRLNPRNAKAHGNVGLLLMDRREFAAAAASFEEALRLNPADDLARRCLAEIRASRR